MRPRERAFEDEVTAHLTSRAGYAACKWGTQEPRDFDPALALDTAELFAFVEATQPQEWADLAKLHGDPARARQAFLARLGAELDRRGTVDVLRHGLVDLGVTIRVAFFRPAHGLTPELVRRYDANRLTVTRQLPYEPGGTRTLDLCLFLNGIPVATAELKNPITGQGVEDAIVQYRRDRDKRNPTLSRAPVHFAVDPEAVSMTTRLDGPTTRFLPFNLGHDGAAGNPPNPAGHRTAYLWERVWERHAWLDLLARFVHVEKDARGRATGLVFPRFHQWDAVLKLEAAARADGAGHSYLVQHSAGSGKSNTIAWLAHRLSTLHQGDAKVFDKVIVITDRLILDRQLQDTIYQLEHAHGVVEKIDENSAQLARALLGEQARIVITTLQKFPFVIDKVAGTAARRYAVIVDEAHSSQTGDAANDLKIALGADPEAALQEAEQRELPGIVADPQDLLTRQVEARGRQPNLSFFAFTATPKGKTLELFGTFDETTGRERPFHLYSMRQAIQEGFILDVLRGYLTYQAMWKIQKAIADDPRYETREARSAIGRYVALHPTNLAQKAEIIVEHFRTHVRHKIGGRAKAMVVTSSRLHAVRYKVALDTYIRNHGYDLRTLVAFSGKVVDGAADRTETAMNKLPESRTAEAFATLEYQVLVVAEKFQTGFDQPLLHTMYVDKVLVGLAAVQTLSRLNRIHPEKEDTLVLDFRNDAEEIRKAFEPYYEETVAPPTDPNLLYDARRALDEFGVLREEETAQVAALLLAARGGAAGRVYAALQPAADRFRALSEEDQERFREALDAFVRVYSFLSQVVSFQDAGLERDHLYGRALGAVIRRPSGASLDLGKEVDLTHLHQVVTFEGSVALEAGGGEVRSIFNAARAGHDPDQEPLSQIVRELNERYGLNLSDAYRLRLQAMAEDMAADPEVRQEAGANTLDAFRLGFDGRFDGEIVKEMRRNEEFGLRLLNDRELHSHVATAMAPEVHRLARVAWQRECPIGELLERGEGQNLEFKSTLEWDLVEGRRNKALRTATVKTIAAFLNDRFGGTLVIGVADDRSIVGLDHDYALLHREGRGDADRFQLHLTQLVQDSVGVAATTKVATEVHHVDGHDVCRVNVEPSGHPVEARVTELDAKGRQRRGEVFYVRTNGRTVAVADRSEIAKYRAGRWGSAPAEAPPTAAGEAPPGVAGDIEPEGG